MCSLFFLFGRLQNPNHTHTTLGKALAASIEVSRVNDKFQEPLYLALELARAGVLHGDLWSGRAYSGGPSFGTREWIGVEKVTVNGIS
jgi:hypothetical protein